MKRKNAPKKVVAISTVAVLALAGISTVSVLSLAKTTDDAAAKGIQNADLDTASGKVAVREDVAETPVVLDVAAYSYEEAAPAAGYDAEDVVAIDEELVVVSSVVENTPSPEDIPVIAAIQTTETVEEVALAAQDVQEEPAQEPVVELAVVEAEPVFAEAEVAKIPVVEEPAAPEAEVVIPVEEVPVVEEPVVPEVQIEVPVYEEPVVPEVETEVPVYEEPVYEEPVVPEVEIEVPVYEEPAYVEPVVPEVEVEVPAVEEPTTAAPAVDTTASPASTTATGVRQQLVDFAASRVGVTPYVWAGRSLETGTDCSGFVNLVYDNFGYYASAGSDDYQSVEGDWGENISYSELQPGDVVVYRNGEHVGIYAGQDDTGTDIIIHDSNEIDGVKVSDMNYSTPTAFVRIIDDGDETAYVEEDTSSYEEEVYDDGSYDEYTGYEEGYDENAGYSEYDEGYSWGDESYDNGWTEEEWY